MNKTLVLDANILIRAVLDKHASKLIKAYGESVNFFSVEEAFEDAGKYIPNIIKKFGGNENTVIASLEKLNLLRSFIQIVSEENLFAYEQEARKRLKGKDEDDWPYLALAILLDCPIWTEDTDFFGSGIAVWTSDKVEIFLSFNE